MHQSSLVGQCQRHKANEVSVSFANRNENLGMLQLSRQQQQQQQQQLAAATSSNHQQQQQQQHQQYQNITPNPNWLPPQTNKRAPEEIDDQRQNAATTTTLHGYRPESHQISQQTSYNSSSAAQQQQQQHQQSLPYCTKHPENFLNNSPANDIGDLMGNYVAKKTYITPFDIPSPPPQPAEHKRFSSGQYVAKATCPSGPGEATATLSGANSSIGNIKSHCQCVEHNVRGGRNGGGCHLNHKHYPQTQTHQRPAAGTSNNININNSSLTTSTQQQQHRNHHHSHHYIDEPLNRTASLKYNNPTVGHHQQYPHHQHHQHPPPPPPHHQQHQPQYRKIDVFAAADDDDNDTSPSIKVRAKRVANFLLL
ncbi:probable basic-leucine zipper transcription factor Q [Musca domestica]|uniref:Probable basic-leucine zipper transcription factor Q n=1 Tax=Musca domestica TaxID=7370 RepID=A0ABM3VL63_MUSDO|nr:probable basic-leucine zipper transcription factor Q [Musca domestica]